MSDTIIINTPQTSDTIIVNTQPSPSNNISINGGSVFSVNGYVGVVVLQKSDLQLGNVDDTSDLDKPISNATLSALLLKADLGAFLTLNQIVTSNYKSWNSVYVTVGTLSGDWSSVYSYVNQTSGTYFNQQQVVAFVVSNSANIVQVSTVVNSTSANWNLAYASVKSLSSSWTGGNSAFTTLNSLSSNIVAVNSFVNSSSSNSIKVDTLVNSTSANWNSAYSSLNSLSATSNLQFNDSRYAKLSSQPYVLLTPSNSIQPINGANVASGDYSFIGGGQNNDTNNKNNSFVFGSNLKASQDNYTYTNNLSSQGIVSSPQINIEDKAQFISQGTVKVYQFYNTSTNSLDTVFV